jgi:hypothetical protein
MGSLAVKPLSAQRVRRRTAVPTMEGTLCGLTGEPPQSPEVVGLVFDPLALQPIDGLNSLLSGKQAIKYRSADLELPLSPDE